MSVLQSPLFVAIDAGAFKRYGMDVSVMRSEEIQESGYVDRLYGK